jgi:molecular chaperone GrpE
MSSADESAIDAMVDEVMAGRAAAEAAVAPAAFAPSEDETPLVEKLAFNVGFADSNTSQPEEDVAIDANSIDDDDVASLRAERDSYLADSQRLAADFANFRKQSEKRVADTTASQSAALVRSLLPVLDACDSAIELDPESAAMPIRSALIAELERNGLELLSPALMDPFDPERHEAVMHEVASPEQEHNGPVIGDVLRAGYLWKGRVARPAMVKVIG